MKNNKIGLVNSPRGIKEALLDIRSEVSPLIAQWERPQGIFKPDASKAAFIIIDMQNFTCAPKGRALLNIGETIANINSLADLCRSANIPVIWVRQNFTTDESGTDAGLYPLFHTREQSESMTNRCETSEIFPGMHYDPSSDHVVFKNRYSAFLSRSPELQEKLNELKRTQLIIAGVAANVCVESTVRDAMQLDYEVVLVADGITALDHSLLENTIRNTLLFFGDVRTVQEIKDVLAPQMQANKS